MGLVKDREYVRTEQVGPDGSRQWVTTEKPRVVPEKIEALQDPKVLLDLLQLRAGPVRQTPKGPVAFIFANGLSGSKRADGTRFRSEVIGVIRYVRVTGPDGKVKNTIAVDGFKPAMPGTASAPKGDGAKPAEEGTKPASETADPALVGTLELGVDEGEIPADLL